MAIEDFLHRFKSVIDTLMAHPQVRLTHVWMGPGASSAELTTLAEAWGRALPPVLEKLYRQANGVQLRWMDAAHETYTPRRDDAMSFERCTRSLWDLPGFASGILEFPTLQELAARDSIASLFDQSEDELHGAIVFESWSESEDTVLYRALELDDPCVGVASDHLADIPDPGEGRLSAHVDHLLATWGSIWHRDTEGPIPLDALLRERLPLDPTRLIGQRVHYLDGERSSTMHGRVLDLRDATQGPSYWDFAPTLAELEDDLGERVWIPLRCLHPPTPDDSYEQLWANPDQLLRALEGPAHPLFTLLAPIDDRRYRFGVSGGPSLSNAVWPYAALCTRLPGERAPQALVLAADTLLRSSERGVQRSVAWARHRPAHPLYAEASYGGIGSLLLDVLVVLAARRAPASLSGWLGPGTTRKLRSLLQLMASRDPLRGYDPLRDPSNNVGFLYRALQGGPVVFDTRAVGHLRGVRFGLSDLRVIQATNTRCPSPVPR